MLENGRNLDKLKDLQGEKRRLGVETGRALGGVRETVSSCRVSERGEMRQRNCVRIVYCIAHKYAAKVGRCYLWHTFHSIVIPWSKLALQC